MTNGLIENSALGLRSFRHPKEVHQVRDWLNDPFTMEMFSRTFPLSRDLVPTKVAASHDHPTTIHMAIERKDEETLIGMVSLTDINWQHGHATIGLLVGPPDQRRKGFGSQAASMLLTYAFETLGLTCVKADMISRNEAVLIGAAKLGFTEVGRIPDWYRGKDGARYAKVTIYMHRDAWRR